MPYLTFPDAPALNGVYSAEAYAGSPASAASLGVVRRRRVDDGNAREHWFGNQQIAIGDVFLRRQHSYDPVAGDFQGTPEPPFLVDREAYKGGVICVVSRDLSSDPGNPMRDPLGTRIFVDDDGDNVTDGRPNEPASGEQARDPWTGALLFEADGTTRVLVP